tara:strand:+ start:717 stop:1136 length:420 start_codon:yes stop_codon:yes gene_type:complete
MIKITTTYGDLEVELYEKDVPHTASNFNKLINTNFYKDLTFHRVIPGFVVQGGCPDGTGSGGPGYTIKCELNTQKQYHEKGVLSMAHSGRDSGGSQFFICHNRHNTSHLDGNHTCFGKIVKGLDIIDKIKEGDKFSIIK